MLYPSRRRPGQVLLLLTLSLVVIVVFVAIALDGGLLLDKRRRVQAGADAAALAAACDIYYFKVKNPTQNIPEDKKGRAINIAKSVAKSHGYEGEGLVVVNIPPQSGSFANDPDKFDYAEVTIEYHQPRGFSSLIGSGDLPVRARAVAGVRKASIDYGALILDRTSKGALNASGNGEVFFEGPVAVNSSDPYGALTAGLGQVTAKSYSLSGNPGYRGNFIPPGSISSGQQPIPDPLADRPVPDWETLPERTGGRVQGDNPVTLLPGLYKGGISITGKGDVTLKSGLYYMQGGGFSITGQGSVKSEGGIMIYNAPAKSSDVVNISGQGVVELWPFESDPWRGILIFQDRTSSAEVSVTGSGGFDIHGIFYVAAGSLKIAGNGDRTIGSQYISYRLATVGDGKLNVLNPKDTTYKYYLGLVE